MRRKLRTWFNRLLVFMLCGVASINGLIIFFGGGNPFILSAKRLPDKVAALSLRAHHSLLLGDSPDRAAVRNLVSKEAARQGLPESFVLAVARTESNFNWRSISSAGAMGVMQLMPGTAKDMKVSNPFNAQQNIQGGTRYLKYLWKRYQGDTRKISAAYNAGPGRVPRRGQARLPRETKHYIKTVQKWSRYFASQARHSP